MSSCALLIAIVGWAATPEVPSGLMLTYQGNVAQLDADGQPMAAQKTLELTLAFAGAEDRAETCYWVLEERGRGSWPWIDRIGQLPLDVLHVAGDSSRSPAVLYDHEANNSAIAIGPLMTSHEVLTETGAQWSRDGLEYEVSAAVDFEGEAAWQVVARNNYGWQRRIWLSADDHLLLGMDQRVFMGQGDEFVLRLRRVGRSELDEETTDQVMGSFAGILALRQALGRNNRAEKADWSVEQRTMLAERLPDIAQSAAGTPLDQLVDAALRDADGQGRRAERVAKLVDEQVGRKVTPFALAGRGAARLADGDLRGRITVLHFWPYRPAPLKEPYGQVGYLDFLYQQHRDRGLRVVGIAIDGRFGDGEGATEAARDVRRMAEFMNLSYPIVFDGGELLAQFGDPRQLGAELPLYVVIGADGRVLHYHVGLHEMDTLRGLVALDEIVVKALRANQNAAGDD